MSDIEPIRFSAQVFKVQTTIDGGIRLTLDMGATDPNMVMALINAKRPGVLLECACIAINADNIDSDNAEQPEGGSNINRREITRNPLYSKQ
jgi:hypothetical protein